MRVSAIEARLREGRGRFSMADEESSPLLAEQAVEGATAHGRGESEHIKKMEFSKVPAAAPLGDASPGSAGGWTVDGLPLGHASVMGEPVGRGHWDSGLFSCLGRSDEFCSSDLEVCTYNYRHLPFPLFLKNNKS